MSGFPKNPYGFGFETEGAAIAAKFNHIIAGKTGQSSRS
jgi:hypothetical protein